MYNTACVVRSAIEAAIGGSRQLKRAAAPSKLTTNCGREKRQGRGCAGGREVASFVLAAALAASFPNIDIHKECLAAEVAAVPDKRASVLESCVAEERKAKTVISQKWSDFSLSARQTCAEANGRYQYSYVELMTCLQVQSGVNLDGDLLSKTFGPMPAAPSKASPILPDRLSPPAAGLPAPELNPRLSSPN
jgi:hypothetical protein